MSALGRMAGGAIPLALSAAGPGGRLAPYMDLPFPP